MYIERWLPARKMSIAPNPAQPPRYDSLHLSSRRSSAFLWPAFYSAKLACRSLNFTGFCLDPVKDFKSRDGALSQRSRRACLHLGCAHSFHAQIRSFNFQNDLVSRNLSSRELGVCRVFIYIDDALTNPNRKPFQARCVRTHAFNPQNGSGGGGDGGRTIFNLAAAGLLTYLTVTGRLNWLFDAILSLWLVSAVLWWFAERSLITGPCPNCGGEFQVFEFSLKEEHRLCPYCSQPFKLENKKFVRDEPQFSNQQTRGFKQPFGGFGGFEGFGQPTSSRKKEDSSGVIVDVEAEVRDKD